MYNLIGGIMNNIYLIYGNEQYFIDNEIKKLIKLHENYECIKYDMREVNISVALQDVLMPSLFFDNKIVICYNCIFLTSLKCEIEHNIEQLQKYINTENENILVLVVNEENLDKRKKICKELEKIATKKVCNELKEQELSKFVNEYVKINKFTIDALAVNKLIGNIGNNLYMMASELEKLFIYKNDDRNITKEDINLCVSRVINSNVFDLVDAIVKKDINKSLMLYDDLLLMNEEEIKLIVILANQFRLIYQVKEMFKKGYSEFDIAKNLDVHPYRVKLANNVCITSNEALKYLKSLSEIDEKIKNGAVDKKVVFEKFILNI